MLEVQPILEFHVQAWTNLIHRPWCQACKFSCVPDRTCNKRVCKTKTRIDHKTTENIVFGSLLPKQDLGLSFTMYFHRKVLKQGLFIWGTCVNFAWISKMKSSTSQKIIFILHGHSSKGWQQNHPSNLFARIANGYLLLAKLNYFCKKLHRRCFRGPGYISDLF